MHTSSTRTARAPHTPLAAAPFTRPAPTPVVAVEVPALPGEPVLVDGSWEMAARVGDVVRVASAPTAAEARALLTAILGLP